MALLALAWPGGGLSLVVADELGQVVAFPSVRVTIDGDTLRRRGDGYENIRLAGIDAPELDQTCGAAGETWPCGLEAKAFLDSLLRSGAGDGAGVFWLYCALDEDPDRYRRAIGTCYVNGVNINERLVIEGLALPYLSERYGAGAAKAKARRAGMWSGPFVTPQDWRLKGANGSE